MSEKMFNKGGEKRMKTIKSKGRLNMDKNGFV